MASGVCAYLCRVRLSVPLHKEDSDLQPASEGCCSNHTDKGLQLGAGGGGGGVLEPSPT